MFPKLRRILTVLLRPLAFVAGKLRVPPLAIAAVVGAVAFVALLAVLTGPPMATTSPAAKAATPVEMSYSGLRAAMQAHTIKSAEVLPAQSEVDVVLKDGSKHTVGYSPTDETISERLAASGAQVNVDTSFARKGFPWAALLMVFVL